MYAKHGHVAPHAKCYQELENYMSTSFLRMPHLLPRWGTARYFLPRRLGPALAEPGCRDVKVSFIHASHALPCVYKTSLPLIYEWAGLTRGAEVVKHTLSSLDSEPEAQEGPAPRPRCSQSEADCEASLPANRPAIALACGMRSSRWLRCARPPASLLRHARYEPGR